ncbi:MAG: GTPase Era [Acidimicrobiia bacterium]|nr:MAG: GTPase Era [Acidimicrobiia bacterium]
MRSGFVPVVGRPNVGKSTLVNALVGSKVSITSPRPQTTRNTIRGVVDRDDLQIVLVDTPGLHRPRSALGERLNAAVMGSLVEADAALFVIEATGRIGPGDRLIAERLQAAGLATVCVVNKVDAADSADVVERLAMAAEWDFAAYVPVSALTGDNLEPVVAEISLMLPEGPRYFPEGMPSDQADEFLMGEIVREKFLALLRDELPHSLAVLVDSVEEQPNGVTRIEAEVMVERESQKGMVIGKGGVLLREAGSAARSELEARFGTRIHLELRVKVRKDWQTHPGIIARLGM